MGGALADAIGGVKALLGVFAAAAVTLTGVVMVDGFAASLALFVLSMLALGVGNGSVFQLVPQRFAARSA